MAMILINGRAVKDPSEFTWGLNDISDSASGRTQDGLMYKNRVAQKRKLTLVWRNPTPAEVAVVLQATNSVYVEVTYPDALSGLNETREFYRNDPSAPVKSWAMGLKRYTTLSLSLIER